MSNLSKAVKVFSIILTGGKVVWHFANGNYVETAQTFYDVAQTIADAVIDSTNTNV
ncbi:hypothetical protein MEN41_11800 [Dolichospermum sp. ST_con]|nr:hypothetical protein [Dolichospermum sp. ST_con]MDD1422189.1 hypothetical protein [Dolichospermum sp. ST_sed1]MDD1427833.1 hypothetical protein [Dolichospermum sp. ST_sed9]MDD1440906.1 hypothetical protein [Dolichospermum sp. ST_sed3]MDD1466143.1 hypothetical protein [Dolichospermum sp. ST_sed5]